MNSQTRGFTLVEMAMVLLILAILMSSMIAPLSIQYTQQQLQKSEGAKEEIGLIKEALLGFLVANRRFPCPAVPTNIDSEKGLEQFSDPATGECLSWHGFVPAVTLGISGGRNADGLLMDPWGNPYRYSLSSGNRTDDCTTGADSEFDFSMANEIARVARTSDSSQTLDDCLNLSLEVCEDATDCNNTLLTRAAGDGTAVVLFSMGPNWRETATSPTSLHEMENVGDTWPSPSISGVNYLLPDDNTFTAAPYASTPDASASHYNQRFDDIVDWISPNIMYNRMLMAGIYPL